MNEGKPPWGHMEALDGLPAQREPRSTQGQRKTDRKHYRCQRNRTRSKCCLSAKGLREGFLEEVNVNRVTGEGSIYTREKGLCLFRSQARGKSLERQSSLGSHVSATQSYPSKAVCVPSPCWPMRKRGMMSNH